MRPRWLGWATCRDLLARSLLCHRWHYGQRVTRMVIESRLGDSLAENEDG